MDILISGFKPFLGETINPSEKIVQKLSTSQENIRTITLPVEFENAFEILKIEIIKNHPDYLIMLGQASGRSVVSLERIALNWVQTHHPDEKGAMPPTGSIQEGAPLARMSKFPIDSIFEDLKGLGLPVEISFSAGAYVCNDLYFRVLQEFPKLKAIFIHVPLIREQLKENDPRPALQFSQAFQVIQSAIQLLSKLR
ncbi:MAG: pyroglutamyl-peptidase I [Bdellovibrionaceae bacterium]|nr:pyroglutamyl-peptidase I [Bdellovibrio sp.]